MLRRLQQSSFSTQWLILLLAERNTNLDTLLSQADEALYNAKHGGRNRACVYAHPLSGTAEEEVG